MATEWVYAEEIPVLVNELDPRDDFVLNMLGRFYPTEAAASAWHLALFEFDEGEDLDQLIRKVDNTSWLEKLFRLPDLYRQVHAAKIDTRFFTALVRPFSEEDLEGKSLGEILGAHLRKMGGPVPAHHLALMPEFAELPAINVVKNDTVIMAVIDNGIAIGSSQFRTGASSRVEHCWLMDAEPDAVSSVSLGRIVEKAQIDPLLVAHLHAGLLDDAAFYRAIGMIDHAHPAFKPVVQRTSHGTHVMSLAAGSDHEVSNRPIICVQLPTGATANPGSYTVEAAINMALDHVLLQASRFRFGDGSRPPLVITLSYGDFSGPHEGTGFLEKLIDQKMRLERTAGRKTRIVLPAGNGNLARCHAELKFPAGTAEHVLNWRMQPDDHTLSLVETFTPARPVAQIPGLLKMRVKPPGGVFSPAIGATPSDTLFLVDNGVVVAIFSFRILPSRERGRFQLVTAPSGSIHDARPYAPHGVWTLQVFRGDGIADGESAHTWVERDETLRGFPSNGRQSRLEDRRYRRFDDLGAVEDEDPAGTNSPVRRAFTLSGYATGAEEEVIVAGAWTQSTHRMSPYSATGPALKRLGAAEPTRPGPDAAAVADHSPVLQGIYGAGSASGSIVRMSGTSVAAPQVARIVADNLAAGGAGKRQFVRDLAVADEATTTSPAPGEARAGGGRLGRRHIIGSHRRRV